MQTRAQWRASVRALVDFYAYPRQALHTAKCAVISMLWASKRTDGQSHRCSTTFTSARCPDAAVHSVALRWVRSGCVFGIPAQPLCASPRSRDNARAYWSWQLCQELPGWGSRASDCSLAADKSAVSGDWCWRSCALPVFSAQQPQQLLPARTKIKRLKSNSRVRSSTASVCWLRIDTVVVDSKSVRVWPTPLLD